MACLPDVTADFDRFYRRWIDPEFGDFGGLSGAQFFTRAERLVAYDGAVTWWLRAQVRPTEDTAPEPIPGTPPGANVVDLTPETAAAIAPGLFEFRGG